jgi:hypothetical protein
MTPILITLALLLQSQTPQQPQPLRPEGPPARQLTPAHDLFDENTRVPSPAARTALHRFSRCVVGNSRELAARTLRDDFTSQRYRTSLRQLSRNNEGCFRQSGRMRAGGLMFAGALAEALLEGSSTRLNVRLARAVAAPATRHFSQSDRVAICTVRSVPDQIGSLLATEPGGAAEEAAVAELHPVMRMCAQGGAEIRSPAAGVRAMLATAAFRSIENGPEGSAAAAQNRPRN